jgi:putative methionine-R-sulfoxide reductase with GAF domain
MSPESLVDGVFTTQSDIWWVGFYPDKSEKWPNNVFNVIVPSVKKFSGSVECSEILFDKLFCCRAFRMLECLYL